MGGFQGSGADATGSNSEVVGGGAGDGGVGGGCGDRGDGSSNGDGGRRKQESRKGKSPGKGAAWLRLTSGGMAASATAGRQTDRAF